MFSWRTDWKLTPNRFTQLQRELSAAGREVVDLTISNPTRVGLHMTRKLFCRRWAILGVWITMRSLEDCARRGRPVGKGSVAARAEIVQDFVFVTPER